MFKSKKANKKGFTLTEMLVVVLIISVLAAISMPMYSRSVERTRSMQGVTTLQSIAKAQNVYNVKRGAYSETVLPLPLDLIDKDGEAVSASQFSDMYFDYKVYGDSRQASIAKRNTGEYEFFISYEDGKIHCSPEEHYICRDYEVGKMARYWEPCDTQLDALFENVAHVSVERFSKEKSATFCQVSIEGDRVDFQVCLDKKQFFGTEGTAGGTGGWMAQCSKGYFKEPNIMMYTVGEEDNLDTYERVVVAYYNDDGKRLKNVQCWEYDFENDVCGHGFIHKYADDGSENYEGLAYCAQFDSNNECLRFNWCNESIPGGCDWTK